MGKGFAGGPCAFSSLSLILASLVSAFLALIAAIRAYGHVRITLLTGSIPWPVKSGGVEW
jgi:hypothetical protein